MAFSGQMTSCLGCRFLCCLCLKLECIPPTVLSTSVCIFKHIKSGFFPHEHKIILSLVYILGQFHQNHYKDMITCNSHCSFSIFFLVKIRHAGWLFSYLIKCFQITLGGELDAISLPSGGCACLTHTMMTNRNLEQCKPGQQWPQFGKCVFVHSILIL